MKISKRQLESLMAGKPSYAKEGDLVKDCIRWLEGRGCFVWKQNQGGMKAGGPGSSRFIRFAHVDGISDIIGLTPAGRFIAVECKQPGNKPTDKQSRFLDKVRFNGGIAIVARSTDDLADGFKE